MSGAGSNLHIFSSLNNDISWSNGRESEIATSHPPGARCNDKTFSRGFSTSILRRAGWGPCLEEVRREGQPAVMLLSLVTVKAYPETKGREGITPKQAFPSNPYNPSKFCQPRPNHIPFLQQNR